MAQPIGKLYSSTLFSYQAAMQSYVKGGLELGRSFVQPQYWGMRSLDYLWQGIGAYLAAHQAGKIPIWSSFTLNSLPKSARDMVAYFYTIHFPDLDRLAVATHPYVIDPATKAHLQKKMPSRTRYRSGLAARTVGVYGAENPYSF